VITAVAVIVGDGSPTATGFGLITRVVVVGVGAADALVAANAATMTSADKLMSNDFFRANIRFSPYLTASVLRFSHSGAMTQP
jgi:hypothetical protein